MISGANNDKDAISSAALAFCLNVCTFVLSEKCKTVEEVIAVRESWKAQIVKGHEEELQSVQELGPIELLLYDAVGGGDIVESLKHVQLELVKAYDLIFDGVVGTVTANIKGEKDDKKNS